MNDILNGLNPMQKQAVLHTKGSLLLLAGAGSGKTRVLTHRIAYLIQNGVKPWNILAITFTNKAAKEMKERIESASPEGKDVWVSTFHSACVRILRREIDHIGFLNSFTIYDSSDSEKLIKTILKENNINDKTYKPKAILSIISSCKNEKISPKAFYKAADDFRKEKIAEIYEEYQKRLYHSNALDFDDLILKTIELFEICPDVLYKYQERFRYILVDEYQDTNTAQYMLVNLLASKYRNLCVVGDDDQSIYAFRGANIMNILNFEKDYPEATVIKLEQNYRSTSTILNAANEVIKNNEGRKSKTLWTDNGKGEKITFFRADSDREEAAFIADNVKRLVNKGVPYSNIAVLYRNNALSRIIGEGMVRASVPYVVVRGHSFYESMEIKDIIAYLKFIYNPESEIDLTRIINVPKRGIGAATVEKIGDIARKSGKSMYEVIQNIESIPALKTRCGSVLRFRELMNGLINASLTTPVSELVEMVLWETGYLPELQAEGDAAAQTRIENLYEMQSKAVDFEQQHPEDSSLAAFLDEISLVSDVDALQNSEEGAVALLTLHASKGLEFPIVFLAGFEDGIFPSAIATNSGDIKDLEEERRLLYVGITRAKQKLYVTCARTRLTHGDFTANPPSRFLREIPPAFVENLSPDMGNTASAFPRNGSVKTIHNAEEKPVYRAGSARPKTAFKTPSGHKYKAGDKVRQLKYGIGTVLNAAPSSGDTLLTIEFKAGVKKLYAGMVKPVN